MLTQTLDVIYLVSCIQHTVYLPLRRQVTVANCLYAWYNITVIERGTQTQSQYKKIQTAPAVAVTNT